MTTTIVSALVVGLLCYLIGWAHAHHTVATECERLGAFYVKNTVYRCTSIGASGSQLWHRHMDEMRAAGAKSKPPVTL